ncbi:hypothetical protein J2801_002188 [Paraburkholderia phenoliruptrix]|uniref:hypothetical protein n=1 Tax=Paraburkholderia phenoliruptrix TaxID=252970 RepID=UPI00285F8280|nr:hypothetical protein [Paraburkholderia phenoliruptrix]MDR6419937.1 hypothetical protein [Paraburkholderia phenoliruptrix]
MSRLESITHAAARETVPATQPKLIPDAAANIDSLDILEVLFLLCKKDGLQVAGDPSSAFAHFDSGTRTLHVYARNMDAVDISSDPKATMLAALDYAQVQGASFEVGDGFAVCTVKGVTAHGYTYGEAAVRALAKLKASRGSQTSTAETKHRP